MPERHPPLDPRLPGPSMGNLSAFSCAFALFASGCGDSSPADLNGPGDPNGLGDPSIVILDTFGGDRGTAWKMSRDGSVVVGHAFNAGGVERAFRWTEAGGMENLGNLGGSWSVATAASSEGTVVVGQSATDGAGGLLAFRWTEATGLVSLGALHTSGSSAQGVSVDGSVVVGRSPSPSGPVRAFRWTASQGLVELPVPHGGNSSAQAITPDGLIAVGSAIDVHGRQRAARWAGSAEPEVMGEVDQFSNQESALGVSNDGMVVVGRAVLSGGVWRAVRWNAKGEADDLNLTFADVVPAGWVLWQASDISADGTQIVGSATSPLDGIQNPLKRLANDVLGRILLHPDRLEVGSPALDLGVLLPPKRALDDRVLRFDHQVELVGPVLMLGAQSDI